MTILRACGICGADFSPPKKNRPGLYCSARCRNTANSRASAERRGDAQRGTGVKWYVKENGRHQHRVVAERTLGRPLVAGEIVHHKDGNKRNNSPDNLVVMTQAEHMREHGLGIPGAPLAHRPWETRWSK